jgi:hypothetical protein
MSFVGEGLLTIRHLTSTDAIPKQKPGLSVVGTDLKGS